MPEHGTRNLGIRCDASGLLHLRATSRTLQEISEEMATVLVERGPLPQLHIELMMKLNRFEAGLLNQALDGGIVPGISKHRRRTTPRVILKIEGDSRWWSGAPLKTSDSHG